MSASDEWTEYHLTPSGWVQGTDKGDFGPVTIVERPKDAVLTVTARSQWSGYSSPAMHTLSENWRSQDSTLITALIAKFGSKPPGVKT